MRAPDHVSLTLAVLVRVLWTPVWSILSSEAIARSHIIE